MPSLIKRKVNAYIIIHYYEVKYISKTIIKDKKKANIKLSIPHSFKIPKAIIDGNK